MSVQLREVIGAAAIQQRVAELGRDISAHYGEEPVIAVCVLKGAFLFFADLVRSLTINPEVDFIRVASYGRAQHRSNEIQFTKDLELPVEGKHLLLVEDIVDTGHTMSYLLKTFEVRKPKSLTVCALIDKLERREVACRVDFPGFTVEEGFLVGYGLDFDEKYRHLGGVFEVVDKA